MSDITMCWGKDCPDKNLCYRYRAVPDSHVQSYGSFTPEEGATRCECFWGYEKGQINT
jgi:hypothetical protein